MADFRGEKTVEINIRTRVGQASGVKGPSSRPGVVRIEVPESFRFLSGVELDQGDVEQLRKLPPSQRGQAIYGSKFLKNKQSGPESLRSSALDIQTLMNRQGGLTVREMLENFNRYNIARNNPSLANRVKMYDSPSSQSHIQSNQMLKEGLGQIAGAALAFPALRGASLAIGALPQVPRMMASIGLGLSWLSSAREGKGPLTIPNWLMGRRNDTTGGMAGLTRGFEVASEAMMLGDLTKGAGQILSGLGFGGRAKPPGSQTPNQPNPPQGPSSGGGGGSGGGIPPSGSPLGGSGGPPRDPTFGFETDPRFNKYPQGGRKGAWGLDVQNAMNELGVAFRPDEGAVFNPQKLASLTARFQKIVKESGESIEVMTKFRDKYREAPDAASKQAVRDEFVAYLNSLKTRIKDYKDITWRGERSLPDGQFVLKSGTNDFYAETNPIPPESSGGGGGQSPAKPPKEPPPEEDGGVATIAPPKEAQKPTDEGTKDFTKDDTKVDLQPAEPATEQPIRRAPKPKQDVEISPELARELIKKNLTPPDLTINENPKVFPNPFNEVEDDVQIAPQPQAQLQGAVIGKPRGAKAAQQEPQIGPQQDQPPERVKLPPVGAPQLPMAFPFFSRYEEPVIQTYKGNFLPVAPSFYSARVEIPGHIINSGRLDYGD